MTTANNLVRELLRAANRVEMLCGSERKRLIGRSAAACVDMRLRLGLPRLACWEKVVIDLQTICIAISFGSASDGQVKAALLDAARTIRELSIMGNQEMAAGHQQARRA